MSPSTSRRVRACALALAAAMPLLGACEGPPDGAPGPPTATARPWKALGTWTGQGERQTESFDITTGSLRLTWRTGHDAASGPKEFRVTLHSAISGRPLQTIVDVPGGGGDTIRFAADPRVAYLLIESGQVDWWVTLEEGLPGNPGTD